MRFNLDDARALYIKNFQSDAERAKLLELELKRYLVLCALHPGVVYGMAGPVDDLWHTFLQFTSDYQRFCQLVAGRFLHHHPGIQHDECAAREFKPYYANLWRDYFVVFGEFPTAGVWPELGDIRAPARRRRR